MNDKNGTSPMALGWLSSSLTLFLACASTPAAGPRLADGQGAEDEAQGPRMAPGTFAGLEWRGIGPALMSGRIADIAIHPEDQSTWYVAVGSGGVWKTVNAGTTWTPIFDDQTSYSIGCIALDPSNPETVWVGTGENVGGRHVGYGDGVYRSRDGGQTWEKRGLEGTEHIGRIVVDPRDPDVVLVAAQGPLWSLGGERGLYKTVDGGGTWERVLAGGEATGVNEVLMDPRDPDVLYASTHQRMRSVAALVNGGPETGIHKSTDGGATWRELTRGLPEEDMGRIGLALSPQDPDVVYATIELAHREGGFYRSADGGESWEKGADYISGGTGPHYYQEIFASPHAFDRVYQMDVWMHVTHDGGKTFQKVGAEAKHSDNHALAFDPSDPDYLLAGCDGGLYESWDLGKHWKFVANLPVTQFYKIAVDDDVPFYNVYGGTQDNSTQGGPSRTDNVNGIRNSDWFITLFADGHQPAVEPGNPDIVYSEWQEGNLTRYDRRTGESIYIQPQPAADEPSERFNWDAPILISPHDPKRLYYASQRVWRSDDRGDSWRAISGDLSRGLDRFQLPMMGRVWSADAVWDLYAMSKYGTVTSLAESPLAEGLIYAGTDDGRIQVTEDGGATWRPVDSLPAPEFYFVNDLKADLFDADTVYACVDMHKYGDFAPYVFRSRDRGRTWESLVGDLPERHLAWRLVQDHVEPGLLFLGTEFGVFFTVDAGEHWVKLEGGVPNIPFRDLAIQRRENDLVGATFGRGIFVLDDYSALREVSEERLESGAAELFPVRDAWWYVERRPLGGSGQASQGSAYFTAPNPPFGAVFAYYLKDGLRTRREARREAEKEIEEQGGDTPSPGWETLREEQLEESPAILFTVRNAQGEVVRRLSGPVTAGFHRVAWDLRFPSVEPWSGDRAEDDEWDPFGAAGLLAPPGTYTVSMHQRVEGELVDLGQSEAFEVVRMGASTLPSASTEDFEDHQRRLADLERRVEGAGAALGELLERVGAIRETLARSFVADDTLGRRARAIERRLSDARLRLSGDPKRDMAGDPGPVSVQARLSVARYGVLHSTYGPTRTHLDTLAICERDLAALRETLDRILLEELPTLEARLDAAGVPWTPGRGGR